MRYEMKMPDLATTESEIRIVRWLVQPGQRVKRGQMLMEVETDKATMPVESAVSGTLQQVARPEGAAVSVGDAVAVLEVETAMEAPAMEAPTMEAAAKPDRPVTEHAADAGATVPRPAGRSSGMFARARAAAHAKSASPGAYPLSVAQRTAARRLQESKQTIPHFYVQTSADASQIVARREASQPRPPAWDAFFVLAVARAITRFPRFGCRWDNGQLVPIASDAIGVAMDESGDLYVLPIASPATKTVEQISDEIRQGRELLHNGDQEVRRIHPALLTITNLGVCPVESFVPIINPPEVAILGVGRVLPVAAVRDGQIGIVHQCKLTLSVDHRVASGRYAGDFLGQIVHEFELLGGETA